MTGKREHIIGKINHYKRRFYLRLLIRGLLLASAIVLSIFLLVVLLEALFRFSSLIRGLLLLSLIGTLMFVIIKYLGKPVLVMLNLKPGMSEKEAALQIGSFFPKVGDQLLNLLQLQQEANGSRELAEAGILQKLENIRNIPFEKAVDFRENRPYVKYAILPAVIFIALGIVSPALLTEPSERIVKFSREFVPEAPFDFVVSNETLRAFRNEDFNVEFSLKGENIPEHAYLIDKDRRIKL